MRHEIDLKFKKFSYSLPHLQICQKKIRSTQGGGITVYGLPETAGQISSVGLYVGKYRHYYRPKHPQG